MSRNNQVNNGGQAFPTPTVCDGSFIENGNSGMTLRDYFAAKALQGALASDAFRFVGPQEKAEAAYQMADAMLAVREV